MISRIARIVRTALVGRSLGVGYDITSDLQAYYRFDGNLNDSSGNSRTLSGSVTYQSGLIGQELATGSATRTPLGGMTDSAGTISGWPTTDSGLSGTGFLIGFGDNLLSIRKTENEIQWSIDSSAIHTVSVQASTRYHVALSYGGGSVKCYLNGSAIYSGSATPSAGWSSDVFNVVATGDVSDPIDEVAIYSRALSDADVAQLYSVVRPV